MSRKSKATDRAREESLTGDGLAASEVHGAITFDSTQTVEWWRRDWVIGSAFGDRDDVRLPAGLERNTDLG